MTYSTACLILACGNTLRSDDGIGPWLASWAEQRFETDPRVRILSRHQWTPDLAEDIAQADTVLFVDCSVSQTPGEVMILAVEPAVTGPSLATHHSNGSQLLALSRELYDAQPRKALLLTVGAGSLELGEGFSPEVTRCLPHVSELLAETVQRLLG